MLKLYNTLTRKKQIFKPLRNKKVGFYACGPTVYDFAHLGNLRTYIFEDILRHVLKYNGYKIKQVMNITDVEDKIIKKMRRENKNLTEITKPHAKIFFEDLKKLNIEKAEVYPKATDHIKEMIDLIKKLLAKKIAYQSQDGSIYFNIAKFKNYGKLSGLKKRQIKIGVRVAADEYNKEEAQDFVLWKAKKIGEPFWPSPFGDGRPGWHIECSAMSMKYLSGEQSRTIDIHAGAVDLIFPHHENEIAQSEAATNKKFANFWLHGEHLLVNNQKMAKSLGNFYTLKDLEIRGFNPLAFRYLVINAHYRSKLNFTWQSLEAAQKALDNLYDFFRTAAKTEKLKNYEIKKLRNYKTEFLTAINDDLNAPKALAIVWQIIKDNQLSTKVKKQLLLKFNEVLGLELDKIKPLKIPQKIKRLILQREKLRSNKQFIQSDVLRKKIERLGYNIEDTSSGPYVKTSATRY